MRKALNILGVGPTHHMFELVEDSPLTQLWRDLANGAEPDWEKLFHGYNACVDWPSAFYWRELVEVYPDAKVLLTMRSPESWWNSFSKTILKYIQNADDQTGLSFTLVANQVLSGRPEDRDHAISVYKQNIGDVLNTVAPERLLVHNLGDGWKPLCRWLDLPVPEMDYPRGNTTLDMADRMKDAGVDLK